VPDNYVVLSLYLKLATLQMKQQRLRQCQRGKANVTVGPVHLINTAADPQAQNGHNFFGGGIQGLLKDFSTTFSRPIPAMFYHVREFMAPHNKLPLPLTDLHDAVPQAHRVVHRCPWSV